MTTGPAVAAGPPGAPADPAVQAGSADAAKFIHGCHQTPFLDGSGRIHLHVDPPGCERRDVVVGGGAQRCTLIAKWCVDRCKTRERRNRCLRRCYSRRAPNYC